MITTRETNICNTRIAQHLKRTKGNQAMKFGQLMEYNMRNIFLEKSNTKLGGGTIPRSFFKKIKTEHICEPII